MVACTAWVAFVVVAGPVSGLGPLLAEEAELSALGLQVEVEAEVVQDPHESE